MSGTSAADAKRLARLARCGKMAGYMLGVTLVLTSPNASAERIVRSLLEMRHHRVVVQNWDLSCGAAALATLLNYQHGHSVTEKEVAVGLIQREEYVQNPSIVNTRQGFSLLDLKRYVDGLGYEGIGLGRITFRDLTERAPVIVPVNFYGYNHFVVFRGAVGDQVLLADPAWGNRTMPIERFERAWIDYPGLGKLGFAVGRRDNLRPPNRLDPAPSDFRFSFRSTN